MRSIIPALSGSTWFVIDALLVQEVMGARLWVDLPHAARDTPGVLAWRGRAVSVLDVGRFLGGGSPLRTSTSYARTLVVEVSNQTVAIPVDAVREVHEVVHEAVRPSASASDVSTDEVRIGAVSMPLLDLDKVIARVLHDQAEAQ